MNATEARIQAESFLKDRDEKQKSIISRLIKDSSSKGSFQVNVFEEIFQNVKIWLRKEGFEYAKSMDDRDGEVTYKITW